MYRVTKTTAQGVRFLTANGGSTENANLAYVYETEADAQRVAVQWGMTDPNYTALAVYDNGEQPKSKWTKSAIFYAVKRAIDGGELDAHFTLANFKGLSKAAMTRYLYKCAWHHTSSFYNCTDFYALDIDALEGLTDAAITSTIEAEKAAKTQSKAAGTQTEPLEVYRRCKFLVWSGTRKHPKATEHEEVAQIVGNWAMTSHGKKSIKANGFMFID